jgi:hypothetical protein
MKHLIPLEVIEGKILMMRGHKVLLDRDLARLYGVEPKRLNEQVKRNIKRFPQDFMFQLSKQEFYELLRSQFATLKPGRGQHIKYALCVHRAGCGHAFQRLEQRSGY